MSKEFFFVGSLKKSL